MINWLRKDVYWIAFNAIMAAAYLWSSSPQWREPELKDVPVATGGAAIVVGLLTLYFLAPLLIANSVWAALIARRDLKTGERRSSDILWWVAAGWLLLILFNVGRI